MKNPQAAPFKHSMGDLANSRYHSNDPGAGGDVRREYNTRGEEHIFQYSHGGESASLFTYNATGHSSLNNKSPADIPKPGNDQITLGPTKENSANPSVLENSP